MTESTADWAVFRHSKDIDRDPNPIEWWGGSGWTAYRMLAKPMPEQEARSMAMSLRLGPDREDYWYNCCKKDY